MIIFEILASPIKSVGELGVETTKSLRIRAKLREGVGNYMGFGIEFDNFGIGMNFENHGFAINFEI